MQLLPSLEFSHVIPSVHPVLVKFAFPQHLECAKVPYVSEPLHMLFFLPKNFFIDSLSGRLWISQSQSPCYSLTVSFTFLLRPITFILTYLFGGKFID